MFDFKILKMINTNVFIENIKVEAEKVLTSANNFLKLSQAQLSWKPSPAQWSAGECFLHLIRVNNYYLKLYEHHLNENINKSSGKFFDFKNSFTGRLIKSSVKPETKFKTKTKENFDPQAAEVPKDTVEKFIDQHTHLIGLAEKLKNLDIKNIKVTSPFNNFIKYNLGDSLEILILHDQRHILQAKNVIKTEGFPIS